MFYSTKRFRFADLVPTVDAKGAFGLIVGFISSLAIMFYIHYRTLADRKQRMEADVRASEMEKEDDIEFSSPNSPRSLRESTKCSSNPKSRRYCFIDCTRGLAICFVTFFHYIWNLRDSGVLPNVLKPAGHELFLQMVEFWVFFGVGFVVL